MADDQSTGRSWKKAVLGIGLLAGAVIVVGSLTGFGWTGQIRLDSGDLRYCFLGVPVYWDRMPEPHRDALLRIAQASQDLRPDWRICVIYPLPTSNNPDAMCRGFYRYAAAWIAVDENIARFALEDIANYVRTTRAQYSLPESVGLFGPPVLDRNTGTVIPDWRSDELVQMYCEKKGYMLPLAEPGEQPPTGDSP